MPLHPQARAYLDQLAAVPPITALPPAQVRQARRALYGKVEDYQIPGPAGAIPVRIYTPQGVGPFPVLAYFHGGGFCLGDLDGSDTYCRTLTHWAGCITVSVDYRLGPEHKFPAAQEDCYAATLWAAENASSMNGDPGRVAVGGDSAGGVLAAAVSLMARDRGTPNLVFQLLGIPATDVSSYETKSWRELGEGHVWSKEASQLFINRYYLGDDEANAKNPLASPLLAPSLKGLPPALLVIAEYDPLRDEAEAYAARLREDRVPTEVKCYAGMIHGFHVAGAAFDCGLEAVADIVKALKAAFAK